MRNRNKHIRILCTKVNFIPFIFYRQTQMHPHPPQFSELGNFWEKSRNKISLRCEVTVTWFSAEGEHSIKRHFFEDANFVFFLTRKILSFTDTFKCMLWDVLDFVVHWCNYCRAGYPWLHPEYKWQLGDLVCVCNDLPHMHRIKCPRLLLCSMWDLLFCLVLDCRK